MTDATAADAARTSFGVDGSCWAGGTDGEDCVSQCFDRLVAAQVADPFVVDCEVPRDLLGTTLMVFGHPADLQHAVVAYASKDLGWDVYLTTHPWSCDDYAAEVYPTEGPWTVVDYSEGLSLFAGDLAAGLSNPEDARSIFNEYRSLLLKEGAWNRAKPGDVVEGELYANAPDIFGAVHFEATVCTTRPSLSVR